MPGSSRAAMTSRRTSELGTLELELVTDMSDARLASVAAQARASWRSSAASGIRSSRRSDRPIATASTASSICSAAQAARPSDSRVLARPHPAGHGLLQAPRHRRHHQRELRRRVDRAHHHEVWLRHGARLVVARRAEGAAADGARRRAAARSRSRSTARAVRRASRSRARSGCRRSPATRSFRFTSKPIGTGR